MQMIMCRACGNFLPAVPDGDTVAPLNDECPDCGGTDFEDIHSDRTASAAEE